MTLARRSSENLWACCEFATLLHRRANLARGTRAGIDLGSVARPRRRGDASGPADEPHGPASGHRDRGEEKARSCPLEVSDDATRAPVMKCRQRARSWRVHRGAARKKTPPGRVQGGASWLNGAIAVGTIAARSSQGNATRAAPSLPDVASAPPTCAHDQRRQNPRRLNNPTPRDGLRVRRLPLLHEGAQSRRSPGHERPARRPESRVLSALAVS